MNPFYLSLLKLTVLSFFSFIIFLYYLSDFLQSSSKKYDPIQKIHKGFVPPIGGFLIISSFFIYMYLWKPSSFILDAHILIPALFIFFIAFLEDFYLNIKPSIRFLVIFIGSLLYVLNAEKLPTIDIILINNFFNQFQFIEIIFYALGLTALANGVNMVDGMNGLAGMVLLSIILGICSLLLINDIFTPNYNSELISLGLLICIFLIFNFPFGKVFLGDSGAYTIGWITGVMIIEIFSLNTIPSWGAVLLISYPILEVIFSTIRKLVQKKNPLKPDLDHIHLKLYYKLKGKDNRSNEFNSFTTLCLMPLWFLPSTMIVWVHFYSHLSWIALIIIIFIYFYFYLVTPKANISN